MRHTTEFFGPGEVTRIATNRHGHKITPRYTVGRMPAHVVAGLVITAAFVILTIAGWIAGWEYGIDGNDHWEGMADWWDYTRLLWAWYPIWFAGWVTSIYRGKSEVETFAMDRFKKLDADKQSAMGGLRTFTKSLEGMSPEEIDLVNVKMNDVIDEQNREAEAVRKMRSQAPHVLEALESMKEQQRFVANELEKM